MKVKELKAILERMDDDTVVVVPNYDHSYRPVWIVSDAPAEFIHFTRGQDEYHEYFGELMFGGKKVTVLVVD